MENSTSGGRWVIATEAPLVWRSWNHREYVVYCTASGDTHLINEVTAEVLRQLERSGQGTSELARNVADRLGAELDGRFEIDLRGLLHYLDQIGLVEPAS